MFVASALLALAGSLWDNSTSVYASPFGYYPTDHMLPSWEQDRDSCCDAVVLTEIEVFRSPRGGAIAFRKPTPIADGDLLYSDDGVTFREMAGRGFAGWSEEFKLTFEDPTNGREFELRRDHDVLRLGRDKFYRAPSVWEDDLYVVPLPAVRQPEYMFVAPDGTILYVSDTVYQRSYDFWFFIGRPPYLSRVPVRDVTRAKDGGTTVVKTDAGVLYSPTPWRPERRATWNGTPLRKLDPARFRIDESAMMSIVRRR